MIERVLAIDMSSKTGWAFILSGPDSWELVASGQIPPIHEPEGKYPGNYVYWAYLIFNEVSQLIETYTPTVLVIEETVAGSKSVLSQKILEYSHFLLARFIRETSIKCRYFLTGEWRVFVGAKMTKEEKLRNKIVRDHKKKNPESKKRARDASGKAVGLIGKKHVNIRTANAYFGKYFKSPLLKKDEDEADALLLSLAYHLEKTGTK